MTVKSDYDRETDFSRYKSYAFLPSSARDGDEPRLHDSLMTKRVQRAARSRLDAKGLEYRPSGADLLVAYHAAVQEKVDVSHYGYHYGRGWYGGGVDVWQYTEGTLVLDFIDAKTKDLVWRGWATDIVGGDPEEAEQRIDEAVGKILERYPPDRKEK
jgi:hypothetical protein